MSNIYDEFDKGINLVNQNNAKIKYQEALERSIRNDIRITTTRIKYQKRQETKKNLRRGAIASVLAVAFIASGYVAKDQVEIKQARDHQRQIVTTLIENGQTKFDADQMLGLMEIFGDEKGVELATGQNWQDYCKRKGYVETTHVSESGSYIETAPSLKVLRNYLEAEALRQMEENQTENENTNDGGKTI